MIKSELNAISDEIDEIRRIAFEAGKAAAIEDMNKQIADTHAEQDRIGKLRGEWQTMVTMVQSAYLAHHGKKLDEDFSGLSPYGARAALKIPADQQEFFEEIIRLVRMGRDFEVLLNGIKTHELLQGSWNKLLVAMRMIEQ